jgi:hypothetical protein
MTRGAMFASAAVVRNALRLPFWRLAVLADQAASESSTISV